MSEHVQRPPRAEARVRRGPAASSLLSLTALGVAFIGTSPLYTLHECLGGEHGVPLAPENILGVLSLIFWSLTMW